MACFTMIVAANKKASLKTLKKELTNAFKEARGITTSPPKPKTLTAYNNFVSAQSAILKVEMPHMNPRDRMREIGKRWQLQKQVPQEMDIDAAGIRKRVRTPSHHVSSIEKPAKAMRMTRAIAKPAIH